MGRYNIGAFIKDDLAFGYFEHPKSLYDIDEFTAKFKTVQELEDNVLKKRLLINEINDFNIKVFYYHDRELKTLPIVLDNLKSVLKYGSPSSSDSRNIETELKTRMQKSGILPKILESNLFVEDLKAELKDFILETTNNTPWYLTRYKNVRELIIKLYDIYQKVPPKEEIFEREKDLPITPDEEIANIYETSEEKQLENWEKTR